MIRKIYLFSLFIGAACIGALTPFWWGVIIPSLAIGFLWNQHQAEAFILAFIGASTVALVTVLIFDYRNESILSPRISELFQGIGVTTLMILSGLINGLLGGLSAALGASLRPIFFKPSTK